MSDRPNAAMAQALAYARRGWPVFPCREGRKEPATAHGFKDATTDPDRISAWWTAAPARNVAIATGAPGPDVLDVDVREDGSGYPAFNRLKRAGLLEGSLAIVATPSGGLHAYYTGTEQPSGRLPAPHLDFKAAGGYVVAPPSQIAGKRYEVVTRRHLYAGDCLDWTAVTASLSPPERPPLAARQRQGQRDAGRLAGWVAGLDEGNRNAGLFWAACRVVEAGRADALDALAEAAKTTGLPETEIRRTIGSAQRAAKHQRSVRAQPQHDPIGTAAANREAAL